MNITFPRTLAVFAMAIAIPLAVNASDDLVAKEHYSGFLKDYSQLKEEKDAQGNPVMRFLSPELTSGRYHKVMIDRVEFYPAPQPDESVDMKTLNEIRDYFDKTLREKVGAQIPLVDQPGPDVVRMRVALTAVSTQTAPLKAYQYIPVALIWQGIKSAAGTRAKEAELYTEVEILDSESGQRIGAIVKKGAGTEVKEEEKGEKKVGLDNVKPILDNWAELTAQFAAKNLRSQ